jgi:hypothetical protein
LGRYLLRQLDMNSLDSDRLKGLAAPAYLTAALLIVFPLIDTGFALLPFRTGELAWRFGALGLVSQALMTPLLGGLIALVTAAVFRHRRALRAVQILAWVVVALSIGAIAVFLLDVVQMRATVRPEMKGAIDKASGVAMLKYLGGAAVAVTLALASQRAIRGTRRASAEGDEPQLVFGGSPAKG